MFETKLDIIEHTIHMAEAELTNIRSKLPKPIDIDPVLKEIRLLKEKLKMQYKTEE